MMDVGIPLASLIVGGILFISAVFDIDWVLSKSSADRRLGRTFARVYYGFVGFVGIALAIWMFFGG